MGRLNVYFFKHCPESDKSSVFGHFALTPWNIPDQKYVDTVVA